MRNKTSRLVPLSEVLPRALKIGQIDRKILLIDLTARWEEFVGRPIARRSRPLKIVGKRLIVEVENPAWAQELSFLNETLREKIRTDLPHVVIDEIRFQTSTRSSG